MNILVTGGAGYVGYSLVQHLLQDPAVSEVTIYDNLARRNYNFLISGSFPGDKVRFVQGELLDSRLLEKEVKRADMIYHLAAKVLTPFADVDSHFFEQVNHWGTATLVDLVDTHPVNAFVYLSSLSVYGRVSEPVNEQAPLHPESFYGVSKKRAEDHVNRLSKRMNTYIIRSGNVYGFNPSVRFDAVINKFLLDAQVNGRLSIYGNGEQFRAFIHVDKLAHVLAHLVSGSTPGGAYNLAEHNLSVNQVAGYIEELYPGLERIFMNQHLQMRELQVQIPSVLTEHIPLPERSFTEELKAFKGSFAW